MQVCKMCEKKLEKELDEIITVEGKKKGKKDFCSYYCLGLWALKQEVPDRVYQDILRVFKTPKDTMKITSDDFLHHY